MGKLCLATGYHMHHPVSSIVSLHVKGKTESELRELNVKCPSHVCVFEYLAPSLWCSLGK